MGGVAVGGSATSFPKRLPPPALTASRGPMKAKEIQELVI